MHERQKSNGLARALARQKSMIILMCSHIVKRCRNLLEKRADWPKCLLTSCGERTADRLWVLLMLQVFSKTAQVRNIVGLTNSGICADVAMRTHKKQGL